MSEALTRRDDLLKELASAHQAEHAARAFIRVVEDEIAQTADGRLKEYTRKARGHIIDGKVLAELEGRWDDAKSSQERALEKLDAARSAVNSVTAELAALYIEDLAAFAAEAEQATARARTALQAVEAPYRAAYEAWVVAQAAWAPLAEAITQTLLTSEQDDGIFRDRGAVAAQSRVRPWLLPPVSFVVQMTPARPAGLRLPQEVS